MSSDKRGGDVIPPIPPWKFRFATGKAAKGWDELKRQAKNATQTAYEIITKEPCPMPYTPRQHPLKGSLQWKMIEGKTLEQWQYEVTGAGRIWYVVDSDARTIWMTHSGPGHPSKTD